MLLIALAGVSLGVLAASFARTERQAFGLFGLLIILQVLFGGLFVPVTRFDYYVQIVSYSLPLSYGLDAMKSVVIRGFSLGDVGMDIIAIVAIIIVASVLAAISLKIRQNGAIKEMNDKKKQMI